MSGPRRIHELDLLRGFFIFVIVVDHLQFWPSPLRYLTGEGRLWVTAAEGFFLISGLLIGYIRAYKGRLTPLRILTKKLVTRAAMLWVWGIGITIFVVLFTLAVGDHPLLPSLPRQEVLTHWGPFLWEVITGKYFSPWIYFLKLYTFMLLATPIFLWLLRKRQIALIVGLIVVGYIVSFVTRDDALQWQVLFFGAALIGYKLEAIIGYFRDHPVSKKVFAGTIIGLTALTMIISHFFVFGWAVVEAPGNPLMNRETYVSIRAVVDPWFENLRLGSVILAFLWFGGLFTLTHLLRKHILRWFGWLLIPFGERSLSVYCLQALLLPLVVILVPISSDALINTIIAMAVVVSFWALLKIPLVRKLLPV